MNSSRIALFLPSLGEGGAQRVVVNLANYYARQGLAVDLLLVKAKGVYLPLVDARVKLVDFDCHRVMASLWPLLRYLRHTRPTALLVTMPHVSIVAACAKLLGGYAGRLVIRQPNYLSLNSGKRHFLTPLLLKTICRIFNIADRVIAISQGVAQDLDAYGIIERGKIEVIYNPLFEPAILSLAEQEIQHPWLQDQTRDYALIIAAGRLVEQKNFTLLLDAFANLTKRKNARLIILGEGRLRAVLQAQIDDLGLTDKVVMPGFCDNPYAYLKRADLFVLSSLWEGFGNVLVEALAVGTPIVATDCPSGPAEILQNGRYGVLVENNNRAALEDGMLKALEQPWQKQALLQRAQDFAIDRIAQKYLQVLLPDSALLNNIQVSGDYE